MKKEPVTILISYALCILFIYAASMKVMDFGQFTADIAKSPLLANMPARATGVGILVLEFGAALLLAFQGMRLYGLYISAFLMLLFSVYMAALYFFYTNIPCSCGGILGQMGYPAHIAFNIAFTLLAFTGLLLQHFSLSYPSTKTTGA